MSPRGSIGCVKMISEPLKCSTQTMHYLASRVAVYPNRPNWASTWALATSKTIFEPVLHLEKTLHHCLQTERNEIPADACHLGVLSGVSKTIPSLWYVRHKPCTYLASTLALSPNKPNRASTWASSPRTTIGASKKWFLILWYVWRKPCTYLVLIQTLPPNGPKRDSTWPTSPWSSIRCVPNNIRAYGMFGTNHAPILR
jgi:hypothetical protein